MSLLSLAVLAFLVLFPPPTRPLRPFLLSTVRHATPHRLRPFRVCVPSLAFVQLCSPSWFLLSEALAQAGAKLHWNQLSPCSSLLSRLPRFPSPAVFSPLQRSATTRTVFVLTATRLRLSAAGTALVHPQFDAYPSISKLTLTSQSSSLSWLLFVRLLHLTLKFHLSKMSRNETHLGCGRKTVNSRGYSELQELIKMRENCYSLIW